MLSLQTPSGLEGQLVASGLIGKVGEQTLSLELRSPARDYDPIGDVADDMVDALEEAFGEDNTYAASIDRDTYGIYQIIDGTLLFSLTQEEDQVIVSSKVDRYGDVYLQEFLREYLRNILR